MRIRKGFHEIFFFFCCSNLSNDDIISQGSGLKFGELGRVARQHPY